MRRNSRAFVILLVLSSACSVYSDELLHQASGGAGGEMGPGGEPVVAGAQNLGDGGSGGDIMGGAGGRSGAFPDPAPGEAGAFGEMAVPLPTGSGSISYELWTGVPGWQLEDIPSSAPTSTGEATRFEAPLPYEDDTAARLWGFLTAPVDGDYTFWISGDDNCELLLSRDEQPENVLQIASILGFEHWADPGEWLKYPSQRSESITLRAGERYYIEARVKQAKGGVHLSVGWNKPGQPDDFPFEIIPGRQLSPL